MDVVKWLAKHIGIITISSILYMLSFHINIFGFTGIYFYDGIIRLVIVVIVVIFVEISRRKILRFDYKDICLSICVFALLNMVWLSLCIVSLDRSLSVFLLCYMEEYDRGMSSEEIENAFQNVFIEKYGMLGRRFDEQVKTGNIIYNNDKYELTSRGRKIVWIFKIVGELYNVDKRFIEPQILENENQEE